MNHGGGRASSGSPSSYSLHNYGEESQHSVHRPPRQVREDCTVVTRWEGATALLPAVCPLINDLPCFSGCGSACRHVSVPKLRLSVLNVKLSLSRDLGKGNPWHNGDWLSSPRAPESMFTSAAFPSPPRAHRLNEIPETRRDWMRGH